MRPVAFGLAGIAMLAIVSIAALAVTGPGPDASAEKSGNPGMSLNMNPIPPRAGDTVVITSFGEHLSQHIYPEDLFITQPEQPVLAIVGDLVNDVWTVKALRPGAATVQTRGTFEKHFTCPTPQDFCGAWWYYAYSPEVPVLVQGSAGDADCNAILQPLDALLILHFAAAMVQWPPCGDASDMNQDCALNSLDAMLIFQAVVSLIPEPEFQPC